MRYHIHIKMSINMLETYDVHHCSAFWKKEEQFLVPEWDMNGHCTLTQHTMVNNKRHSYELQRRLEKEYNT